MKKIIFVMIGAPGSGKTTCAEMICRCYKDTLHISSDNIRETFFGDVNRQDVNYKVFNIYYKIAKEAFSTFKYQNIILDATNISKKERRKVFSIFKDKKDILIVAIDMQMNTSKEKCYENNRNRDRNVPEYVIDKMIGKYKRPTINEGFDAIFDGKEFVKELESCYYE